MHVAPEDAVREPRLRARARCGAISRVIASMLDAAHRAAVAVDHVQPAGALGQHLRQREVQGRVTGTVGTLSALGRRRVELELAQPANAEALEPTVLADEAGHEVVGGRGEQLVGGGELDQMAVAHDRDPVAHLDRLVDVVGDEDDRFANLPMKPQEIVLEAVARDRIDRAERLVHQHDRWVGSHRPRNADALLLTAGELSWIATQIALWIEPDQLEQLRRPGSGAAPLTSPAGAGTMPMLFSIVMCGNSPICWNT